MVIHLRPEYARSGGRIYQRAKLSLVILHKFPFEARIFRGRTVIIAEFAWPGLDRQQTIVYNGAKIGTPEILERKKDYENNEKTDGPPAGPGDGVLSGCLR
jgi:hypothetical protein